MKKLRISSTLNLHSYPEDDILEYIRRGLEFHKNAGFDAADFPCKRIDFLDDNWKSQIEKVIEISEDTKMKFEICHLPFSLAISYHPEELPAFNQKMHNAIDGAAMLGVDYAVLHPNAVTMDEKDFDRKEQYDIVMSHLAPFAEHAQKVNLKLAVENMRLVHKDTPTHRYCQNPDELCEVADALGIGICWDFGHANTAGLIQSEALSYIGKRLKVLHVNDNYGLGDDHLIPFMGKIDWKDAMKGLSDIGYEGLFNYELHLNNIPKNLREINGRYLVEVANELLSYL